MPIWAWVLLLWLSLTIPVAVLVGRSIHLADVKEGKSMVRYPESRFNRRLKARREARAERERREMLGEEPVKHPLSDPRIGDDRRRAERRVMVMSAEEVEDWLKRNGISTGDRRHNDRRQGDRRR